MSDIDEEFAEARRLIKGFMRRYADDLEDSGKTVTMNYSPDAEHLYCGTSLRVVLNQSVIVADQSVIELVFRAKRAATNLDLILDVDIWDNKGVLHINVGHAEVGLSHVAKIIEVFADAAVERFDELIEAR